MSNSSPARLLISLAGHNKVSMAFHAGALCALRDLGLLQRAKILCGSGTGNWVLGFLMHALQLSVSYIMDYGPNEWRMHGELGQIDRCANFTRAWIWLTSPAPVRFANTDVKDGFVDFFLRPLLRFCETGVSGACMWQRVLHPWRYTQPWATELFYWAQKNLFLDCTWADCALSHLSCEAATRDQSQEPLFAAQCYHAESQTLLSLSNDCYLPLAALNRDRVKGFGPPMPTHLLPLSRAVTLCSLPLSTGYPLTMSLVETSDSPSVSSSLLYDPLALTALRHYYLRHIFQEPSEEKVEPCVCVVIDAVTGTPLYHENRAFRSLIDLQSQVLLSNPDRKHSEPRALRFRIVRAIDTLFMVKKAEDEDEEEEEEKEEKEQEEPSFLDHLRRDHSELEALPSDFVQHVANWGKAITHFHYDPLGYAHPPLLFPSRGSQDLFGFSRLFERGDPTHLSLQLQARHPRDFAPVLDPPALELSVHRRHGDIGDSKYEEEQDEEEATAAATEDGHHLLLADHYSHHSGQL